MDFLYDIPLLGFIFQIVGYLINAILNTNLAPQTLALATPIALGALCGVMNERSGVVNIGIEGMMLTAAFVGFMAAVVVSDAMPDAEPSAFFGVTPALLVGVLAAIGAGMLVSVLHAWLSISVRADQIISGTVINIIALGLTGYLNRLDPAERQRRDVRLVRPARGPRRPADRRLAVQHVPVAGTDHDVGDRVRDRSCRSCCSGRAGASAREPSASTRGQRTRSAST